MVAWLWAKNAFSYADNSVILVSAPYYINTSQSATSTGAPSDYIKDTSLKCPDGYVIIQTRSPTCGSTSSGVIPFTLDSTTNPTQITCAAGGWIGRNAFYGSFFTGTQIGIICSKRCSSDVTVNHNPNNYPEIGRDIYQGYTFYGNVKGVEGYGPGTTNPYTCPPGFRAFHQRCYKD